MQGIDTLGLLTGFPMEVELSVLMQYEYKQAKMKFIKYITDEDM